MDEFNTVLGIGFGQDAIRAIAVAMVLSLLMKRYAEVWTFAGIGLAIDRLLIPLIIEAGASDRSGASTVASSAWRTISSTPTDLGEVAVRYVGLMILLSVWFGGRCVLHHRFA